MIANQEQPGSVVCPVGACENSPAIDRWVQDGAQETSPVGMDEEQDGVQSSLRDFDSLWSGNPSDKSLGYGHFRPYGTMERGIFAIICEGAIYGTMRCSANTPQKMATPVRRDVKSDGESPGQSCYNRCVAACRPGGPITLARVNGVMNPPVVPPLGRGDGVGATASQCETVNRYAADELLLVHGG
jgi:hypothetical protein